jgi:hypothetical protein
MEDNSGRQTVKPDKLCPSNQASAMQSAHAGIMMQIAERSKVIVAQLKQRQAGS